MKTSIRWDKMFGSNAGKGVDVEHILPLGGHLYVVGIQWVYVNPSWVQAFPFTEVRDWVTNSPSDLVRAALSRHKESAQEYHRQRVSGEPVPRAETTYRFPIPSGYGRGEILP